MKTKTITSVIKVCSYEELSLDDQRLVDLAKKGTHRSYSPYSRFSVGAAVALENGEILIGCNQENAAFGVTICAERSALFAAGAQYPDVPVKAIAIAARNADGFLKSPVTPCGSCRQAMIETETRYRHKLHILLYGLDCIYVIDGISTLMPLSFDEGQM